MLSIDLLHKDTCMGLHGAHLEGREINSSACWIRHLPLGSSISDLIIKHVADQVAQDAVQSGELELVAVGLDRATIGEAKLDISHVQRSVEPIETLVSHYRPLKGYQSQRANL